MTNRVNEYFVLFKLFFLKKSTVKRKERERIKSKIYSDLPKRLRALEINYAKQKKTFKWTYETCKEYKNQYFKKYF